jgi:ubiquitin thioesterase protein OTUB1
VSNSIVVFLRLLTSAQLRADVDTYAPFLFHPETGEPLAMRAFCETFVEAVDREAGACSPSSRPPPADGALADHVQITALARALRLNVSVAYLDGHADDVDFVDFANAEGERPLVLLYRWACPLRRAGEMLMRF